MRKRGERIIQAPAAGFFRSPLIFLGGIVKMEMGTIRHRSTRAFCVFKVSLTAITDPFLEY